MNIAEYMDSAKIVLDLKASNKEEAIRNLAQIVKDSKEIEDYNRFLNDIFEREELGTTGIGLGVALPHARTQAVNSFVIAVGKVTEGVDFKSLDGEAVKLIFLMGTPKDEVQNYLKILAHLTRLLKKESVRTPLFEAKTPQDIIEIFRREEESS